MRRTTVIILSAAVGRPIDVADLTYLAAFPFQGAAMPPSCS
ncbi:MAG: hypothetical protein AB1744_07330 [Candidatus Zixiibacteriota bacterium]